MQKADKGALAAVDYSPQADGYEKVRYGGSGGAFLYRTDRAIVRELAGRVGASTCIDIPTGTGRTAEYLSDLTGSDGRAVEVMSFDVAPGMLRKTQQKELGNLRGLVQCNGGRLPLSDGVAELMVSLSFFHLFAPSQRAPFAREFARVLAPGGHLLVSFSNGWYAGGLNWLRRPANRIPVLRALIGSLTIHFLMPGELNLLFPGWEVRALRGNFLPFQRLLAHLGPQAEAVARWLTWRTPLNLICFSRFYLLRKPGGEDREST